MLISFTYERLQMNGTNCELCSSCDVMWWGLLLPLRLLHAFIKGCCQMSFLKATNKEVSAHIQLWDPSDIQSGLDAKDLWVLSATELLIKFLHYKEANNFLNIMYSIFFFCLQTGFPHTHFTCNSIMSNAFYFQRLHYLLLLSLPILYFSNWSGKLCFPKTSRSSKQSFPGIWKHPTSISKKSCLAGWSQAPKPSQLLSTMQLTLKIIHKLTGIAKIASERSVNYSYYEATGIQFWLIWPHILSIKWLWCSWCKQIHIVTCSFYWEISEKAANSLLATLPMAILHLPIENKIISKINVKFVLLSLPTKALPASQEVSWRLWQH